MESRQRQRHVRGKPSLLPLLLLPYSPDNKAMTEKERNRIKCEDASSPPGRLPFGPSAIPGSASLSRPHGRPRGGGIGHPLSAVSGCERAVNGCGSVLQLAVVRVQAVVRVGAARRSTGCMESFATEGGARRHKRHPMLSLHH